MSDNAAQKAAEQALNQIKAAQLQINHYRISDTKAIAIIKTAIKSALAERDAEIERLRAIMRRAAQRKEERDLSLAERDKYLPLGFDIMGEIRVCSEEIEDDAIACECTLGILKRIEERDTKIEALTAQVATLESELSLSRAGLRAVASLIDESRGVDGLHLNGDLATWDELRTGGQFEDWLIVFDEALASR